MTQDTEKCALPISTGVHINPVILKKIYECLKLSVIYMGVCMKRVSLEWGSFVLFLFCELDFEQPLVDACSL